MMGMMLSILQAVSCTCLSLLISYLAWLIYQRQFIRTDSEREDHGD